jgi:putative endonuclease
MEVALKEGKPSTFYVYLIKDKNNGKVYLGSTNDLRRRLVEHRRGKVFSTKKFTNFTLIYYEAFISEKDARMREKSLKYRGKAYQELKKRIGESLKGAG